MSNANMLTKHSFIFSTFALVTIIKVSDGAAHKPKTATKITAEKPGLPIPQISNKFIEGILDVLPNLTQDDPTTQKKFSTLCQNIQDDGFPKLEISKLSGELSNTLLTLFSALSDPKEILADGKSGQLPDLIEKLRQQLGAPKFDLNDPLALLKTLQKLGTDKVLFNLLPDFGSKGAEKLSDIIGLKQPFSPAKLKKLLESPPEQSLGQIKELLGEKGATRLFQGLQGLLPNQEGPLGNGTSSIPEKNPFLEAFLNLLPGNNPKSNDPTTGLPKITDLVSLLTALHKEGANAPEPVKKGRNGLTVSDSGQQELLEKSYDFYGTDDDVDDNDDDNHDADDDDGVHDQTSDDSEEKDDKKSHKGKKRTDDLLSVKRTVPDAKLGQPCASVGPECSEAFSICLDGKCNCAQGTTLDVDICRPDVPHNCQFGTFLKNESSNAPLECRRFLRDPPSQVFSSEETSASPKRLQERHFMLGWQDTCPSGAYCSVAGDEIPYSPIFGICCPLPKPTCPIGIPLEGVKCGLLAPEDSNILEQSKSCPIKSHYCRIISLSELGDPVMTACCPRPCPIYEQVYYGGRCWERRGLNQPCEVGGQCSENNSGCTDEGICKCNESYQETEDHCEARTE